MSDSTLRFTSPRTTSHVVNGTDLDITPDQYYAAKARMAEEGAATTLRLKVARLVRKGWTQDAALSHIEGACDQALCMGSH